MSARRRYLASWTRSRQHRRLPSIREFLEIWGELVEAYCGKNGFGGDTAELYAYRFMRYAPGAVDGSTAQKEQQREAALALWYILKMFGEMYECARYVNKRRFGAWVKQIEFDHRVHVRVVSQKRKRRE